MGPGRRTPRHRGGRVAALTLLFVMVWPLAATAQVPDAPGQAEPPDLLDAPGGLQHPDADHLDPERLEAIDDARFHGTVTPPGTDLRNATAEIAAYDDLVQGYPDLTEEELRERYFKHRRFGAVEDAQRAYQPREGVKVFRTGDWGEPVIFGDTDEDLAFGAGFVAAEDRLVIMELLRALGRAEAFDLLGTTPAWLADAEIARLYGYTEEELQEQIDRLPEVYGQDGQDIVAMGEAYVAGINEYLAAGARGEVPLPAGLSDLGIEVPAPWRPTDLVAAVSIVRALFGAAGGAELTNAAHLADLVDEFGVEQGTAMYEDFRNRVDEDGPVHVEGSFPYNLPDHDAIDPDANVLAPIETAPGVQVLLEDLFAAFDGDVSLAAAQLGQLADDAEIRWDRMVLEAGGARLDLSDPGGMSNYLVVDGEKSATGHPILLGGPQAAYFSPQILMDYELHSPTISARGAGFPGLSLLVIMGRTGEYAWTPTAGGSDMIDTYVVELCEPDGSEPSQRSNHYRYDGECVEMDRRVIRSLEEDAPVDLPGRDRLADVYAERTVHGPVVTRGEIGDTPVAVARKRSTYRRELDPAISILRMNRGEARTGDDFVDIFVESHNLSTNWAYASRDEIAYVHGGLYPIRPRQVHPDFPVWGDGRFEWATDAEGKDRWLGREQWPHEVAPERGYLASWNNRVAADWGSADSQRGFGSVYRGDLLVDPLEQAEPGSLGLVEMTQIMQEAGLTDLRGYAVAPMALRVMEAAEAPGPREERMVELLDDWIAEGALRRDGDGDGTYDHDAAIAVMDAWWERMIRAVFDPVLGDASRIPHPFDNPPGPIGSAYQGGFYSYLWTDLAMLLGDDVASPTSRIYCGGGPDAEGTLEDCAEALWGALAAAGDELADGPEALLGGSSPDDWGVNAELERIRFLPAAVLSMHWVNRPTSQQLAMFGHHDRDGDGPGVPDDPGPPDHVGPPDHAGPGQVRPPGHLPGAASRLAGDTSQASSDPADAAMRPAGLATARSATGAVVGPVLALLAGALAWRRGTAASRARGR
jgi:acyl-homoserine lactone acylase PvdQ